MAYLSHDQVYDNVLNIYPEPLIQQCGSNIYKNNLNAGENLYNRGKGSASQPTINCTYCINSAVPAVKSCLLCEAALCTLHLQVHSQSPEHVLTIPLSNLGRLRSFKCSTHKEVMKYFCFEDAAFMCVSCCLAGQHKGHKVELLDEACNKKKNTLRNLLEKITLKQKNTERRFLRLQQQKAEVQDRATLVTERVTALFCDLRRHLEELERRVLRQLSAEEERISRPFTLLIRQLELQQEELSQSISHIEELINCTDPLAILTKIPENEVESWLPTDKDNLIYDLEDIDEGVISVTLHRSLKEIMDAVKIAQGSSGLLLDTETAANDVYVSGDKKTVSWTKINQHRQKNLSRFKSLQVLSSKTFNSGRHYWEVQSSQSGGWIMGVCYPSTERKGSTSVFGNNSKSWCLSWKDKKLFVVHDQKVKHFLNLFSCYKVGVYLDYEAGRLSFYKLDEPIRHLHTFMATFTEPLYAAFSIQHGWLRIKT